MRAAKYASILWLKYFHYCNIGRENAVEVQIFLKSFSADALFLCRLRQVIDPKNGQPVDLIPMGLVCEVSALLFKKLERKYSFD